MTKRLATNKHWSAAFYTKHKSRRSLLPKSFASVQLISLLKPYVQPGQHLLEIGAAPGAQLLALAKALSVEPWGVDYNAQGVRATKQHFIHAGYDPSRVIKADLFDRQFRKEHAEQFDIVFSAGFIEHFTDIKPVLAHHTALLKKGGLLVITVPNLVGIKPLVPRTMLEKHNLLVLQPKPIADALPKDCTVLRAGYYGGLGNAGLVYYANPLLETARLAVFAAQRIMLDPLQRAGLRIGLVAENRITTPYAYVIARKNR